MQIQDKKKQEDSEKEALNAYGELKVLTCLTFGSFSDRNILTLAVIFSGYRKDSEPFHFFIFCYVIALC